MSFSTSCFSARLLSSAIFRKQFASPTTFLAHHDWFVEGVMKLILFIAVVFLSLLALLVRFSTGRFIYEYHPTLGKFLQSKLLNTQWNHLTKKSERLLVLQFRLKVTFNFEVSNLENVPRNTPKMVILERKLFKRIKTTCDWEVWLIFPIKIWNEDSLRDRFP